LKSFTIELRFKHRMLASAEKFKKVKSKIEIINVTDIRQVQL